MTQLAHFLRHTFHKQFHFKFVACVILAAALITYYAESFSNLRITVVESAVASGHTHVVTVVRSSWNKTQLRSLVGKVVFCGVFSLSIQFSG